MVYCFCFDAMKSSVAYSNSEKSSVDQMSSAGEAADDQAEQSSRDRSRV